MAKLSSKPAATVLDATDDMPITQDTGTTPVSKRSALSLIRDWITGNATGLSVASGTITASAPVTLTQTWNSAGVTFTGLDVNVTNTASASGSLLVNLRVNSASRFAIGHTQLNIAIRSDGSYAWSSSTNAASTLDLFLYRDAAAQLAIRNSTTAQSLAIYTTESSSLTNYERLRIYGTAGDVFTIASEAAGTGTVRGIAFATGGTTRVAISAGGTTTFSPSTTNDQAAIFNSPSGSNAALHFRGATVPSYASAGASPAWTTTTTGVVAQGSAGNGGIAFSGFTGGAATNSPVYFAGYHGNVSSTAAAVAFVGRKHDGGTNFTSLGSTQLVAEFVNSSTSLWSINGAGLLQGGGITSSFPALKRSGTILQARLADDSAYGTFQGKLQTDANAVSESITPTHTLTLYDAAGTAYKVAVQAA